MKDYDILSERIHDADSEVNENMVHWLHEYLNGGCTREKLMTVFMQAYEKQEVIDPPWVS
jgi:cytochrome c-type biogenesis protein CcmH/NrfF